MVGLIFYMRSLKNKKWHKSLKIARIAADDNTKMGSKDDFQCLKKRTDFMQFDF